MKPDISPEMVREFISAVQMWSVVFERALGETPIDLGQPRLKTIVDVRAEFATNGLSIAEWARRHSVSKSLVYEILSGRRTVFRRGDTHRVAVLLGLKNGEITQDVASINTHPAPRRPHHKEAA